MSLSDQHMRRRLDDLEREARERPRRHALRLLGLVALGYAYPLLLLGGAFGVLMLVVLAPFALEMRWTPAVAVLYLFFLAAAMGLVTAVLAAFRVELPPLQGHEIRAGEAEPLRDLIAQVQRQMNAPGIDRIYISPDLNASVTQRRGHAFWGRRKGQLQLGLPLLRALTPQQFRAVLAHEFGHLRGRHSDFGAWIYRVERTWQTLAFAFNTSQGVRWMFLGWFIRWYGSKLAIASLPLRRLHEYHADRAGAQTAGGDTAARTLITIDWTAYQMSKRFWPALIREAVRDPLPPGDLLRRIGGFLENVAATDGADHWRQYVIHRRTPIGDDHPCLNDRLTALGCGRMLARDDAAPLPAPSEADSALALLGERRDHLVAVVNAAWKAMAIHRWRYEHALAKQMREKAEKEIASGAAAGGAPGGDPVAVAWRKAQLEADLAGPDEAAQVLALFLADHPDHAEANFSLGCLLLQQYDEAAVACLETAMRGNSDHITPALNMLLQYYREAGRDDEAEPIRHRLEEHEKQLLHARKERLTVKSREKFLPHNVNDGELQKLRRVLLYHPRIRAAYLAQKQVNLFTDKPSYVLAIERRFYLMEENRRADKRLIETLHSQLELPCAVVILKHRAPGLRRRIQSACPTPIFVAPD